MTWGNKIQSSKPKDQNPKQIPDPRSQAQKIGILKFGFWICFVLWILTFGFIDCSFAFSRTPPTVESFSFVVFGDNQDGHETFKRLIKMVNEEDIDFAVHVGDTVQHATRKDFENYLHMISKLRFKLYQVPGNHDLVGDGYKYYKEYFGPFYPHTKNFDVGMYYSFDHKNSHFVVLNNAFKKYFDAKQFEWLKKDLQNTDKENIFIIMHRPTFDPSEIYKDYVMSEREVVKELMRVFVKYKVDYVIAGHIHGYARTKRNGIVYIVTGGAGGQLHFPRDLGGFHHYAKIKVNKSEIKDEVVKVYE